MGDLCPKGDQDCGENQVCDLNMAYGSNGIQIGARCVCKDKYEDDGQGSCTLIPGFCDFDVCNDYKDCEDCEAPLICAPTGVCAYPPAEYAGGAAGLASPSSPEDPEPNGGSGKQLGDLCPKGDQDCGENQVCDLNMAYGSNGIQIGARCKCQDGYEDDGEGVCRRIPHPFCLNDAWCGTVFANQICVLASNTCICKPGYETVPSPDGWVPSFTCQLAPGSCWNDADCPEGNVCDVESNACVAPPIGVAPASTVGIVFPSLPGGRADPLPRPGRGRDDDDDDDDAAAAVVRPSSPRDDTTTPPSRPPPREEEDEKEESWCHLGENLVSPPPPLRRRHRRRRPSLSLVVAVDRLDLLAGKGTRCQQYWQGPLRLAARRMRLTPHRRRYLQDSQRRSSTSLAQVGR
uniref:EGF-like domain-containing protein n=1 Tax=Chloropicon primus TaxID=1764295 RepID=A0A7S2X072_9CHLO